MIEVLVASIVFLTVFFIVIDASSGIRSRMAGFRKAGRMEADFNSCRKKFEKDDSRTLWEFGWGKVEFAKDWYPRCEGVWLVTVTLTTKEGMKTMYRYLEDL